MTDRKFLGKPTSNRMLTDDIPGQSVQYPSRTHNGANLNYRRRGANELSRVDHAVPSWTRGLTRNPTSAVQAAADPSGMIDGQPSEYGRHAQQPRYAAPWLKPRHAGTRGAPPDAVRGERGRHAAGPGTARPEPALAARRRVRGHHFRVGRTLGGGRSGPEVMPIIYRGGGVAGVGTLDDGRPGSRRPADQARAGPVGRHAGLYPLAQRFQQAEGHG